MKTAIYIKTRFRGNPRGEGEGAAVVEYIDRKGTKHIRRQYALIKDDTKNALHLKISIAAIRMLIKPCDITLHTDCEYIKNICRLGWLKSWQQGGWKKANGKPPANAEEWKQIYMLSQIHTIEFKSYDTCYEKELDKILNKVFYYAQKKKGGKE